MSEGALYSKIVKVVQAVDEVAKTGHNDHFNYDFVTAETILKAIRVPLAAENVALMPSLSGIEERSYKTSRGNESVITTVHVDFTFADGDTGELFKCAWAGQGDDPADKGLGKAYTNCIKTFLRETFLLPQGDDPEADASTDKRSSERKGSGRKQFSGSARKASEKQVDFAKKLLLRVRPKNAQIEELLPGVIVVEGWTDKLTSSECSTLIEALKEGTLPQVADAQTPPTDVPADPDDFVHPPADGAFGDPDSPEDDPERDVPVGEPLTLGDEAAA